MIITEKRCSHCKTTKPISDFNKDKYNKDGYCCQCRICGNEMTRRYRKNNHKAFLERQRQLHRENREKANQRCHDWYLKNSNWRKSYDLKRYSTEERKARTILNNAVRAGHVIKPKNCEACKKEVSNRLLHGHHDNYNEPLTIRWLCCDCHGDLHRKHKLSA